MSEIATTRPEFKTSLIKYQDKYMGMIEQQMAEHRIGFDEYQKTCVQNALSAISTVMETQGISFQHADVDQSSITQILLTVAGLRLNASATPREVYFQIRNMKKTIRDPNNLNSKTDRWVKVVEMGIEGDGNDALLRNFGVNVKKVGQFWTIREGDEFTPPRYKGMTVEPPVWVPKGTGGKVYAIVYGIVLTDNSEQYYIAYRADVKANLLAHISNTLMNHTFGIAKDRYSADPKQKAAIANKKQEVIDKAAEMTLDEILDNKDLAFAISPAWREPQSREAMIIRKMRNNIVKKIPKDFGTGYASTQYGEAENSDFEPITKDIGGDPDSEPQPEPVVVDITPDPKPPEPIAEPVEARRTASTAKEVKEPVKVPKPRPRPAKQAEPEPEPELQEAPLPDEPDFPDVFDQQLGF